MIEVLPGVFHWSTFHEGIGATVHSYLLASLEAPVLLDPRMPESGIAAIAKLAHPQLILLTNRLHYRHSGRFANYFGASIHAHRAGAHAFGPRRHRVRLFDHGANLPSRIRALKVGAICPEETAFLLPISGGILSLGDAVIREGRRLSFVDDELMGENPEGVKRGLRRSLGELLKQRFDHLLLAHGKPWIGGAKKALRDFLGYTSAHQ